MALAYRKGLEFRQKLYRFSEFLSAEHPYLADLLRQLHLHIQHSDNRMKMSGM